jgi:hypothetical protein
MSRLPFISIRRLRGCLIVLNGVSYRITSIHARPPEMGVGFTTLYEGQLACLHLDPQFVRVMRKRGRLFMLLGHPWLQHGHKGVIHVFADIKRFGSVSGPDRWLRVPLGFPYVPSAETAVRVAVPWRERKPAPRITPYIFGVGPITPLDDVEPLFPPAPEVRG